MVIGCLTGNSKRPPLDGTFAFYAPGLTDLLAPDLHPDHVPGGGPFAFRYGALTDGDPETGVGWRSATVGETGVDVVVQLGAPCFVDRVILHQPPSRQPTADRAHDALLDGDNIEAVGHVEPEGVSRVEVYAVSAGSAALALVGRVGQRGPGVFPDGPVSVGVGVEAVELVVRLISYHRDIRLTGMEIWGAGPGEPAVFPVPVRLERLPGPPLVLSQNSMIQIGPTASDDGRFAATMLAEKVEEAFGWSVPVREETPKMSGGMRSSTSKLGPPFVGLLSSTLPLMRTKR